MTNQTPESVIAEAHHVAKRKYGIGFEAVLRRIGFEAGAEWAANMLRESGEPDWEYVGMAFEHGGFMLIRNDQLVPEKFESWRKLVAQYPWVEILKRIKSVAAGPWLRVEGESDD